MKNFFQEKIRQVIPENQMIHDLKLTLPPNGSQHSQFPEDKDLLENIHNNFIILTQNL